MPKLGLKTDRVKLVKYSKGWINKFERERRHITKLLNKEIVTVEHIGSTAIRGIISKPMVDIVLGVNSMSRNKSRIVKKLEKDKYVLRKFRNPNQHLLLSKIIDGHTTHHVHIVRHKGVVWNKLIDFRNYLNSHPSWAKQYEILKKKLAKKFPNNRKAYTLAKAKFVRKTLEIAKKKNYA